MDFSVDGVYILHLVYACCIRLVCSVVVWAGPFWECGTCGCFEGRVIGGLFVLFSCLEEGKFSDSEFLFIVIRVRDREEESCVAKEAPVCDLPFIPTLLELFVPHNSKVGVT